MSKRSLILALLIAIVAAGSLFTWSAQNPAPAARGATAPVQVPRVNVETFTLDNGLQVMVTRRPELPVVAVNTWYHVGPANEAAGRTGFAHLFEHMMFQASKHVPEDSFFRLLESAGASDINGSTSFDFTNYYATVPANQVELALWLESDRMGYLLDVVDEASLANQQDVVRNERRQRTENAPYGMAEETLFQTLFPKGHPYHGVVIGSHEDIQAAKLADVKQFFKEYYGPNNATVSIVGDIEPKQALQLVQKYFGSFKRGPAVKKVDVPTPRITSEQRKVVPSRVQLPKVYMAWISPSFFKPGDAEADVTATILGSGRSSRLYKKLVYERQIAQDVSASQYSLMLGSVFSIEATARPGRTIEELEKAIDEELAALAAAPPDASEVTKARNKIETSTVTDLESISGLANRLNLYNHYVGKPDYLQADLERYSTITPASVHTFVREQLKPSSRVVVHAVPGTPDFGPQVATPPPTKSAAGTGAESIHPDEPWRAKPPAAGAARTATLPTPTMATLPNGLTLLLNERKGLPVVSANLVLKTGSDANPLDKPGLANFVAAMLDEGTTTRNALQIADEVAQLGASLSTSSSMDATMVSGTSLTKNFGSILELVADVTLHPQFPQEEVERQRASRLAALLQRREDPGQVAAQVAAAALFGPKHPYGFSELGTEASVKGMTRDDMVAFWQKNFVPNNAALVVAGEISMSELRALAEKAFGGWKRGEPVRPSLGAPTTTQARVVIVDVPGAPQTQLRVVGMGAPRSTPDFRPIQLMNNALGGNFASRINMNLREKNGYSYGTYSQFAFRRNGGMFQVAGGVRTDVTGPAAQEVMNELRGILEKPVTPDELARAKDGLANSLPGAFETSANAVSNFSNVFVYDLGLDYYAKYAQQVRAVTEAQAQAATKKYIVPGNFVVVAVGDRKSIEPALQKLNLGPIEIRDPEGRVVAANQ
jgi:zinc protease